MAAVSGGAYESTLHTSLLPLPVIYTDIYTDIHTANKPPSSHIPMCVCVCIEFKYEFISTIFFMSFSRLNP